MIYKTAIKLFFNFMLTNGRAEGTAQNYRRTLEAAPWHQDLDLKEITPPLLQDYMAKFSHLSPGSRNLRRAALKSFFGWAVDSGFLEKNPGLQLRAEKDPVREAPYLSLSEIRRFKEALKTGPARDQLLFELLLGTGGRLGEIAGLSLGDVRGKESFEVVGKGKKARRIFLNLDCRALIASSINGEPPGAPLFISARGERLSRQQIHTLAKKYFTLAGLPKKLSCHSLRHTFASHLAEKNRDLNLVARALGHSSIQTTMRYSHLAESRLANAVEGVYNGK
jgi:integrase/recombinase XerC